MGFPQNTRQPDMPSLREGMPGERVLLPAEISGNRLEMYVRGTQHLEPTDTCAAEEVEAEKDGGQTIPRPSRAYDRLNRLVTPPASHHI